MPRRFVALLCAVTLTWCLSAQAKKNDCTKLLWSRNLWLEYDGLTSDEQLLVQRNQKRYVDLDKDQMDDDLRTAVRAARERVKTNLGFLPSIRRGGLAHLPQNISDVKLFLPNTRTTRGTEIAFYAYKIDRDDHKLLISDNVWVNRDYRHQGLSELMWLEILAAHPWIKDVKVEEFQKTNLAVFIQAYKSMSCREAIRETPSYKKFAAMGFSKLAQASCKKAVNVYTDERGWRVSFTVERR